MLSVFETLKEALLLWMRNFRYVAPLALVLGIPTVLFDQAFAASREQFQWLIPLSIVGMVIQLVTQAVTAAFVLGLIRREILGLTAWKAARSSVAAYTWTLLLLECLIMLIAMAIGFVAAFLIAVSGAHRYVVGLMGILSLVLIKYALGDPLVVVENRNARDALATSWRMTRGHFWYVMGCYLFFATLAWLIEWALTIPTNAAIAPWLELVAQLTEPGWPILAWCMYLRIKAADASPAPIVRS